MISCVCHSSAKHGKVAQPTYDAGNVVICLTAVLGNRFVLNIFFLFNIAGTGRKFCVLRFAFGCMITRVTFFN